jgi:hypothetical protein
VKATVLSSLTSNVKTDVPALAPVKTMFGGKVALFLLVVIRMFLSESAILLSSYIIKVLLL